MFVVTVCKTTQRKATNPEKNFKNMDEKFIVSVNTHFIYLYTPEKKKREVYKMNPGLAVLSSLRRVCINKKKKYF